MHTKNRNIMVMDYAHLQLLLKEETRSALASPLLDADEADSVLLYATDVQVYLRIYRSQRGTPLADLRIAHLREGSDTSYVPSDIIPLGLVIDIVKAVGGTGPLLGGIFTRPPTPTADEATYILLDLTPNTNASC